jgi:signal transduction histidine kinase
MTLRYRILLTLLPLLALLAALGVAGVILLHRLTESVDAILRENYDSVIFMERLKEHLERIDSSFTFALAGQEEKARAQYEQQWKPYLENLHKEQNNITVSGEAELVQNLTALTNDYRAKGDAFYNLKPDDPRRRDEYFRPQGGLEQTFYATKKVADAILRLNQDNMEQASSNAKLSARDSMIGFAIGLIVAGVLAGWLAWRTVVDILQPIQEVTRSAYAIGVGNLDQVVSVSSRDELGQLAEAFNAMARQLRQYRQSDYAKLLRAQRTSQATIDSFPDPVLVVDPEGSVEMANPAAQQLFGVAGRPGDGQVTLPWKPPLALRDPLREAIEDQRPHLPEEFYHAIDLRVAGQVRSFLPRILPIRDPWGHTLGAAVLLEDVTRFRLLDQVKSDLVATASHELKTPLTSVRLALHLLLEETIGPLNAKQTELLLDARDNAERLLAVVNNLLDLARLEQGHQRLNLHAVPPAELMRSAVDTSRARADDKGVTLNMEIPPELPLIAADEAQLSHALANLFDNALTYTDRGGTITFSVTADENFVTFTVADTGVGIAADYLPHVFDRFFRIPGQSRGFGTGLGLAIVREIVTAHGGTIACTSKPGSGSVFRLTLPIWRAHDGPHHDDGARTSEASGQTSAAREMARP